MAATDSWTSCIRFSSSAADFAIEFIDAGKPLAVDWNRLPRFKDERDRVIRTSV